MRPQCDLFGVPIRERPPAVRGYAARPGTGPRGQRCNTCSHCMVVVARGRRSRKCELMAAQWTHEPATDVKHNAPACEYWERKPPCPMPALQDP